MSTELATPVTPDPMTMLQTMIDKGFDPDKLGKMMDLAKQWKDDKARAEYNTAMIECQSAMPIIYKDSGQTNKPYASIENIHINCKPIWLDHGFALSFTEDERDQNGDMITMRCDVQHKGGYVKTHFGRYPRDGKGAQGGNVMNALQGTVSAHSYAERDMTSLIFNIVVKGRDKDGVSQTAAISTDQANEILNLTKGIREVGLQHDNKVFLGIFGVEKLEDMPATLAPTAIRMLKKKAGVA